MCLLNNEQRMLAELIFLPKPTSMRASSRVSWHYRSVESMTKSSTRVSCLADSCCQHEKQPDKAACQVEGEASQPFLPTKPRLFPWSQTLNARSPISRSRSQHKQDTRADELLLITGTSHYDSFIRSPSEIPLALGEHGESINLRWTSMAMSRQHSAL